MIAETQDTRYTPDADALDALADRVAAAELDKPLLLLSLAGAFDQRAKAVEPHDLQAAVRVERLANQLRTRAIEKPFRAYTPSERAELVTLLRHQAVFARRVEAALGKPRPNAAPVLALAPALARRQQAEAAARRERMGRLIDRVAPPLRRPSWDPDGGDAA